MTRPKDREESGKTRAESGFDDVWGELVDSASSTPKKDAAEQDGEGTKEWTEDVRGERARADGSAPNDGSEPEEDGAPQCVPAKTDKTKAWTEEVRAERKMTDANSSPTSAKKSEPTAATSGAFVLGPLPGKADAEADATMDALMTAASAKKEASGAPDSSADLPAVDEASSSGRNEKVAPTQVAETDDAAEVISLRPDPTPEPDDDPLPEPSHGGSKIAILVVTAAIVAVGAFLWFGPGAEAPKNPKQPPARVADANVRANPVDEQPPPAHTPARPPSAKPAADAKAAPKPVEEPPPPPTQEKVDPPTAAVPPVERPDPPPTPTEPPEAPTPRTGDPREPPPGTPDDIAAVFRKLPVSPADQPPVGGVGASGIHIDAISMGSTVDRARCKGESSDFSIGRGDEVNVCLRVVHPRTKEEVVVLWQKDGGTRRRGKVVVKPAHAYRTRAYLKLRSEYVGRWTVKILSGDVVLASHEFNVVK